MVWCEFKNILKQVNTNSEVDNLKNINGCVVWNIDRENYSKS